MLILFIFRWPGLHDPTGFRVMAGSDVDPAIGALLMTDTNEFHAVNLNGMVNMPYWDLIFDYFLTDVTVPLAGADGTFYTPGQPVCMVDPARRGQRHIPNMVGVLDYSGLLGRIANAQRRGIIDPGVNFFLEVIEQALRRLTMQPTVDALLARPSLRLAIPQTHVYEAIHKMLYGGGLFRADRLHHTDFLHDGARLRRDVLKVERQAAFDSIHLAPRMKADTLTEPPFNKPEFQLNSISMAPFCEHDCLHTHWRWGLNWADWHLKPMATNTQPLKGFALAPDDPAFSKFAMVGVPYSEVGNPMTPFNQRINMNFPNAHSFTYTAHITLDSPHNSAIHPGVWQPVFHHGSVYSLTIANPHILHASVLVIANPPELANLRGEVSELYWYMRFQATRDGPLERIEFNFDELQRMMSK